MSAFAEASYVQGLFLQSSMEDQFQEFQDDDDSRLTSALAIVVEYLSHLLTNPSEFVQTHMPKEGTVAESHELGDGVFYRAFLRSLGRFASHCPYTTVRDALVECMIQTIEVIKDQYPLAVESIQVPTGFLSLGPASLMPEPTLSPSDPHLQRLFIHEGRISNLNRLLAWHPNFLELHHNTLETVLCQPGPLTLPWRHFLCIMAAARHRSGYLVEAHTREFIKAQGDLTWLRGLDHTPPKLQAIGKLNALLAHQAWLITPAHIEELMKGSDAWSMAELVHALIIMSLLHSLSGLVTGLSIFPEADSELADSRDKEQASRRAEESQRGVKPKQKINDDLVNMRGITDSADEISSEVQQQHFAQDIAVETDSKSDADFQTPESPRYQMMARLRGYDDIKHSDFNVKSTEYHVFRSQTFSWGENGYYTARHVLPDAADALDKEFSYILDMTDFSINGVNTESTEPFRHALWYYTHRLYGILHDDYSYEMMNKVLKVDLKHFVKRAVCMCSDEAHISQLQNSSVTLLPHEQVHVLLLIVEARKQAELLYGLRAIMQYRMGES